MVVVNCPKGNCDFKTDDMPMEIVVKILELHILEHKQQQAVPQVAQANAPKLIRPHIDVGVNQEAWVAFTRRWETYKRGSRINDDVAAIQLFQCTSEQLGDILLKSDPKLMMRTEEEVLKQMESIAVIKVSICVTRTDLMRITQENDEVFRTFAARVRGKAETCDFKVHIECECGKSIRAEYTEEVIRDVLLAGISDIDIRREVLGMEGVHKKTVNDIISLVESCKISRHATSSAPYIATVSTFKQQKKLGTKQDPDKNKQVPCPCCNKLFFCFRKRGNSWNQRPYQQCLSCWRAKNKQQNCIQKCESSEDDLVQQSSLSLQISALNLKAKKPIILDKIILSKNELRRVKTKKSSHPRLCVTIKHDSTDKSVNIRGIADSGAQADLWGLRGFRNAGFNVKDLQPVKVKVHAANKNPIRVLGAFTATVYGLSPDEEVISSSTTIYVSDSVDDFFMSYDTLVDLMVLSTRFPTIGEFNNTKANIASNQTVDDSCHTSTPLHCQDQYDFLGSKAY